MGQEHRSGQLPEVPAQPTTGTVYEKRRSSKVSPQRQAWGRRLLLLLLPLALASGLWAHHQWSNYLEAERLLLEANALSNRGETELAVARFEEALELYPGFYQAWAGLSVTLCVGGQHAKEAQALERAVVALPKRGEPRRDLALAYRELGRHQKALEELKQAQLLALDDRRFTQRLEEMVQRELDSQGEATSTTGERTGATDSEQTAAPDPHPHPHPHPHSH